MPTYNVYGTAIQSDLPLPGLDEVEVQESELTVSLAEFQSPVLHPDGPLHYFLDEDYWYFHWLGEATYRLSEFEVAVMIEGDSSAVSERIAGPLFGLLLRRAGRVVLHGNVVSRDGQALCLLGSTGAGKTTLTRSLLDAGWLFLSDDLCVLEEKEGAWLAHPGPSRLKVRTSTPWKSIQTPSRNGHSARLHEIVVLEPGAPVSRKNLSGSDALMALVRHAHMPRSLDVAGHAGDHLHQSGRLAASVSISLLKRGTDLSDLPKAIGLLDGETP